MSDSLQSRGLYSAWLHGILQARVLEWVAKPFPRGSSRPRDWTHISFVSYVGKQVLYRWSHLGSLIQAHWRKVTPPPNSSGKWFSFTHSTPQFSWDTTAIMRFLGIFTELFHEYTSVCVCTYIYIYVCTVVSCFPFILDISWLVFHVSTYVARQLFIFNAKYT